MMVGKLNIYKLIKYVFFGITTAGLEFGAFLMLLPLTHIYIASTISFLVGLIASFVFNKFAVFKNSKRIHKIEILQFVALGLFNSQFSSLMTTGLTLVVPPVVAKAISIAFIAIWNFLIMNFVIFKKNDKIL